MNDVLNIDANLVQEGTAILKQKPELEREQSFVRFDRSDP